LQNQPIQNLFSKSIIQNNSIVPWCLILILLFLSFDVKEKLVAAGNAIASGKHKVKIIPKIQINLSKPMHGSHEMKS